LSTLRLSLSDNQSMSTGATYELPRSIGADARLLLAATEGPLTTPRLAGTRSAVEYSITRSKARLAKGQPVSGISTRSTRTGLRF
jgi:hypothetical protein